RAAWNATPWSVAFSPDSAHVATQVDRNEVVIWDVADGNDRLRASPPAGVLLALGPGGSRIVVASADETVVWDTQLDVARAVLPGPADGAALPGRGEAIFVVEGDVSTGVRRQRVLALPEAPAALAATFFPGVADGVERLRFADGVAEFLEVASDNGSGNQRATAGTHTIRLHRLEAATGIWSVASTLKGVTAFAFAPDDSAFAAAAGGQVIVVSKDRDTPPQRIAAPVAVDQLAFTADGASLLAFA